MRTWTERFSEHALATLVACLLAVLLFCSQLLLNPTHPPNHNDFVGLDGDQRVLWAPFLFVEGFADDYVDTLAWFEVVSFISVSVVLLALFWMTASLSGDRGGVAAAVLFAVSPFALSAPSVVPLASLIGLMLASLLFAASLRRGRWAAMLTVFLGLLTGFFPVYGVGTLLVVGLTRFFEWIGLRGSSRFRTSWFVVSVLPTLALTVYLDWSLLSSLLMSSFSVVSQTLSAGLSTSTMVTWFGPITLLLAVGATYRSLNKERADTALLVALALVGLLFVSQRFVDPLLAFGLFGLGVFGLCGVAVQDVLGVDVKRRYVVVVYGGFVAVLLVALVNVLAFLQLDVASSRPAEGDLAGYEALSSGPKRTVLTPPRETALAAYYDNNLSVNGSWSLGVDEPDVFGSVFVTDLVRLAGENGTIVVSNWAGSRYDTSVPRLNESRCFDLAYAHAPSSFTAWTSRCSLTVSETVSPLAMRNRSGSLGRR